MRQFNGSYQGEHLNHVALPLGGMGAGMVCLEGTGALSHVSLRHRPEVFHEPEMFAAVCVKGVGTDGANVSRVIEGQVPMRKVFGTSGAGNGLGHRSYGLPRFGEAQFAARMPFGEVKLTDAKLPLAVRLTGWSPFVPTDADASSLPVAALEYELTNTGDRPIEGVFSYHARNPLIVRGKDVAARDIRRTSGGFVLRQPGRDGAAHEEGALAVTTDAAGAVIDAAWFRSGWFDVRTLLWRHIERGDVIDHEPHTDGGCGEGASIYVPFTLKAGEKRMVRIMIGWYVPHSQQRQGPEEAEVCRNGSACGCAVPAQKPNYEPWYAGRFTGIDHVMGYWREQYESLRAKSKLFADCLQESTLPAEVIEAVAANLTILKSPTVLRDKQGRIWAWEGCGDDHGCCHGTCTHVWNYAQALPHVFADMERSLRETEFNFSQNAEGKQVFRSALPIRPMANFDTHAAADGQLGGIMKVHREWRISGDNAWLKQLWPAVRKSLEYCIEAWDPTHEGVLKEPHHNTYDIEFWGADGMCSSFYLGALLAAVRMGEAVGDDVTLFDELYRKGRVYLENKLFNGEYFYQEVQWEGLRADVSRFSPLCNPGGSSESRALEQAEGPKYQYGTGCLSDGVLGAWMAQVCGVGDVLDRDKVLSHLLSVVRYNFKRDLSEHANPERPSFALGKEGGVVVCTWPRGGRKTLAMVYCDEVFTGIEYQIASHLMMMGHVEEALQIVRTARARYDGRYRNPFNEIECGNWYARAMSSYAMLGAMGGVSYDAVSGTLTVAPRIKGDFNVFFSAAGGFGVAGVKDGEPFVDVRHGAIDVKRVEYVKA